MDLTKQIKVQGGHAIIVCDVSEEVHQDELTIAFSSVACLLLNGLGLGTTLDDHDGRCATASNGW